ncbi:protein phosphatase 2C domain-containing protein [Christensenellaceae bacterium OttesenSCG-928-M15]|nr:protein phosphatase 2C domain-containing protein [Christensenellaceae bacterium OttesenSCG-928-M15]
MEITQEREEPPVEETIAIKTAMSTHIGTREYQQDALYVSDGERELVYGVLCDGMGGMEDGEKASAEVVEYLVNRLEVLDNEVDIPVFFEQTIREANEKLLSLYGDRPQGPGTTLVTVVIKNGELYWASVGDSRIYIIRDSEIARMTRDHNYALQLEEQVRNGKITAEQARLDPMREALISYIGAPVLDIIDVSRAPFLLQKGDVILLCSDGLYKSLSDERILELLLGHEDDAGEKARTLPLAAFDESTGGQDNTSVIVIQYGVLHLFDINNI